jgi:aspartate kinase
LIVMKFGGTSVADARRILAIAGIVRRHRARRPVVVVSALAGVTDLLVEILRLTPRGGPEVVEPVLADLERRHRWAASGAVEPANARHDLNLAVGALFEDLRQLIRSIRTLGEATPRAADALLAFGEILAGRIVTSALQEQGVTGRWVDPREVVVTDATHGSAESDLAATAERCRQRIGPILDAGEVPVLGGFVGATHGGETTTLGRGGSDTSAAVLGCVMEAEEIQIWTDVDGLMSADPRMVPAARTLSRVSFAEAAELALYGAKVLHPAAVAPAVQRHIPVRILNSLRPDGPGTVVVGEPEPDARSLAAVASRGGVRALRFTGRRLRMEPGSVPRILEAFERAGVIAELVVSSEVAVTVVVRESAELGAALRAAEPMARVEQVDRCALISVVGSGLARDPTVRGRVLAALSGVGPEIVALGGSGYSVAAVVRDSELGPAVAYLHREFFEETPGA